MKIPLIKPVMTDRIIDAVRQVMESGHLTEGHVTRSFEKRVADYVGVPYAMAVTSCTSGLEIALRAIGIGPGDEVIVPDYTYPATASVVNIVGATAVVVDVDAATMLVDYDALEEAINPRTKAAIPVSLFGNPLDWGRLNAIKHTHSIFLIEDAACALGSSYQDRRTGSLADISVFSFHPRKFITTGEGGLITTNKASWANWISSYKHFGMAANDSRHDTTFEMIGINGKLSDVLAAIGLAQMDDIDEMLAERSCLAENYQALFYKTSGVHLPEITPGGEHSWQTFCVFLDDRNHVMEEMRKHGIEAQIGTYALHMHRAFNDNPLCRIQGDMSGSTYAFEHCLALPMYHAMTAEEQEYVLDKLFLFLS